MMSCFYLLLHAKKRWNTILTNMIEYFAVAVLMFFCELIKIRNHFSVNFCLLTEMVFALIETVMEKNPLRGDLCAVTDVVFFFLNRHRWEISFF